jgi:hypothetical protein
MRAVKDGRGRVRLVEESVEPVEERVTTGSSAVARLGKAWLDGWQAFAHVAGGRAEDLVGGNPWSRSRESDDVAE